MPVPRVPDWTSPSYLMTSKCIALQPRPPRSTPSSSLKSMAAPIPDPLPLATLPLRTHVLQTLIPLGYVTRFPQTTKATTIPERGAQKPDRRGQASATKANQRRRRSNEMQAQGRPETCVRNVFRPPRATQGPGEPYGTRGERRLSLRPIPSRGLCGALWLRGTGGPARGRSSPGAPAGGLRGRQNGLLRYRYRRPARHRL